MIKLILIICGLSLGFLANSQSDNASVYLQKSKVALSNYHYDSTIMYCRKAYTLYPKSDNNKMTEIYSLMSYAYSGIGDYQEALNCNFKAISFAHKTTDSVLIASQYNQSGSLFLLIKRPTKALGYLKSASRIFQNNNRKDLLAISLSNMAMTFSALKDYENEYVYMKKGLNTFKQLGDSLNLGKSYNNLGAYFDSREQLDSALFYYKLSFELARSINDELGAVIANGNMAEVYSKLGNYELALSIYSKTIRQSIELDDPYTLLKNYENIAELYKSTGDQQKAISAYEKIIELKERLFSIEQSRQIANLEVAHNVEMIELENEKLEAKNLLKDREIKTKEVWILLIVIALIFVLVASFFLVRHLIHLKETNRLLLRKNLQILKIDEEKTTYVSAIQHEQERQLDPVQKEKYDSSHLDENEKNLLFERVEEFFKKEKIFLDTNLNLEMLANDLKTSRNYISQVINEKTNNNFNHFVNLHRIKECQKMMASGKYDHYTIEALALECGFKSKSVFNKAFKEQTGLTPSFYMKNVRSIGKN